MPAKRILRILTAAIAILALAAFLALWIGPRTPWARRLAADWISETTGLQATIAQLRVGVLRGLAVEAGGLALGQPPGFGPDPLLSLGAARIELPWSGLFGGAAVDAVELADATLRLSIAADGSDNWSALVDRLAALGGNGESAWSIGRVALERGALEFRDAASGTEWRLTAIAIAAERLAPRTDFPVDVRLAGVAGEGTFHFAFNGRAALDPDAGRYRARSLGFRGWAGGDPLPLAGVELAGRLSQAAFDSQSGVVTIDGGSFNLAGVPAEFGGTMRIGASPARMELTIRSDAFAPRAPAVAFGVPLPATADTAAFGSFRFTANCRLEDGLLVIDPVEARLDDTEFDGRIVPQRRLFRLAADRIDLDRYLPPGGGTARAKKATLESAIADLGALDVDAEIRVARATLAGATLRGVVLRVEPAGAAP